MKIKPRSHVQTGLNDYEFVGSLSIGHPTIPPERIVDALKLPPTSTHRLGDQKTTPGGQPLTGTWQENHVTFRPPLQDGEDPQTFLKTLLGTLDESFIKQIGETGGTADLFVGLFATHGCDFELPPTLLKRLGELGISIRFDYYHTGGE